MGKLKIIPYIVDGHKPVYVPNRVIENINKKTIIKNQYVEEGAKRKLVIEYESKLGGAHGVAEMYDMGLDTYEDQNESEGED